MIASESEKTLVGFFERLCEIQANGLVAVLEAYFDESQRPSGIFCIAGFVFYKRDARMFTKDWQELFGCEGMHMVDLVHGRQRFDGIPVGRRNALIRKAVPIIRKRMTAGVAISCNVHEVGRLSPRWITGFGDAYPVCCHLAMFALGNWLRENNCLERVVYMFEAGHKFAAEAARHIENAVKAPELKEAYRYHGHAFLPKTDATPLQAADFLAWEWAKFRDETLEQRSRRPRGSLVALMGDALGKFCGVHITGPSLAKYMYQIRQIGLEQLEEDRQENAIRQRKDAQ